MVKRVLAGLGERMGVRDGGMRPVDGGGSETGIVTGGEQNRPRPSIDASLTQTSVENDGQQRQQCYTHCY